MVHDHPDHAGFSLWSLFKAKQEEEGATKAAKCDMCGHLSGGPACVRSCPTGAALRVNPGKLLEMISSKTEVKR